MEGHTPSRKRVADAMSPNPATIQAGASVVEAARAMREHRVGALPVCDGSRPIGILTDRDIVVRGVADGHLSAPVSSLATLFPYSVRPGDSLTTAQRLMTEHGVRRLVVATAGGVVGVISSSDIARCSASAPGPTTTPPELETSYPEDEPALLHEP